MDALPLLTLLTLSPAAAALLLQVPALRAPAVARGVTLVSAGVSGLLALLLVAGFRPEAAGFQFVERHPWIPTLGVQYLVGVDGLGLAMVVLTALLVPLAVLVTPADPGRAPAFHGWVLLLQAGLFGGFTALDFLHWFLFWELTLVPAYFLIKLWGSPGRVEAATQFFVYTFAGSVAMLLAMQAVVAATGTLDLPRLAELARGGGLETAVGRTLHWTGLSPGALNQLLCLGVLLGLAVKVPLMPLHTWLPATYATAPTGVVMLLTGVMSKLGLYGFLRILVPLFPGPLQAWQGGLLALAVLTVVAAALAAWAQGDWRRLLAYSSVNHLGLCLLGVFAALTPTVGGPAWAVEKAAVLNGVVFQMFSHGVTAATLFGLVGVLEQRTQGHQGLGDFGGLRRVAPVYAGFLGIALFASLGLPGLSGFIGEFLIFKGAFPLAPWPAALATLGLLGTALFSLTAIQRVFTGPVAGRSAGLADLTWRERWVFGPFLFLMLLLGVAPQVLIRWIHPTVTRWVEGWPR